MQVLFALRPVFGIVPGKATDAFNFLPMPFGPMNRCPATTMARLADRCPTRGQAMFPQLVNTKMTVTYSGSPARSKILSIAITGTRRSLPILTVGISPFAAAA